MLHQTLLYIRARHPDAMYVKLRIRISTEQTDANVAHEQPKSPLHGIESLKSIHLSSQYYVQ